MKEIKQMIDSAITASDARTMLRWWYSLGKISAAQLEKGTKYVKQSFEN
jgi:hypothetical protein